MWYSLQRSGTESSLGKITFYANENIFLVDEIRLWLGSGVNIVCPVGSNRRQVPIAEFRLAPMVYEITEGHKEILVAGRRI